VKRKQTIFDSSNLELRERVIEKAVKRNAKVMKGGRRFSFSALVVTGNGAGVVGFGRGKSRDVPAAVEKASKAARKELERIAIAGETIPHTVTGKFGASKILMRPAAPGTGVIACAPVREVVELVGVKNILTKSFGSNNPVNLVKATMDGLRQLRTREEVAALRGVKL
jgi:small subunit ribosomal protein S5